jgi:helicase SWR1
MRESASSEALDGFSDVIDTPNDEPAVEKLFIDNEGPESLTPAPATDNSKGRPLSESPTAEDEHHPAKRRRLRETTPDTTPRKKPESPPWKKSDAEGPSSFTENGRRKSGRINTIPLEVHLQGGKRLTRRAIHDLKGSPLPKQAVTPRQATITKQNGVQSQAPTTVTNGLRKSSVSTRAAIVKPAVPLRSSTRRASTQLEPISSQRVTRKRTPPPPPQPTRQSTRSRRSTRQENCDVNGYTQTKNTEDGFQDSPGRTTRIKLRVRSPSIPLIHPEQANMRPKSGLPFEEYWERSVDIPVELGGQFSVEDGPRYTDDMARKDAQTIMRIELEAEPGGLLSEGRCAVFIPEPEEEPPRQWAHMDHLVKAMANFRKLMLAEQQRHRSTAKRLAEACRDEWLRRQPKSAEQLEAEERDRWIAKYRVVARVVLGTWINIRTEINRRRVEEWELAEQKRVKAALNEAVNISEQKLQARRTQFDSDGMSVDDSSDDDANTLDPDDGSNEDSDLDGDADMGDTEHSADDDDIMSSSDEENDMDNSKTDMDDEKLTQDQLRAKYANLPGLVSSVDDDSLDIGLVPKIAGVVAVDVEDSVAANDTSDESVDMDDDLGSTDDMDSASDDDASDGDEEDSDEESNSGLLGLFFGKSELKKMQEEATSTEEPGSKPEQELRPDENDTMNLTPDSPHPNLGQLNPQDLDEEEDEVSLIQHPDGLDEQERDSSDVEFVATKQDSDAQSSMAIDTDMTVATEEPSMVQTEDANEHAATEKEHFDAEPTGTPRPVDSQDTSAIPNDGVRSNGQDIPQVTVTSYGNMAKRASPDTDPMDPNTNPPSVEQSQSPPTTDTKLSDVDTDSRADVSVPSRFSSPQLTSTPKTPIPILLRGTLREYQHYGLDWLAGLYANNTNGILADEMGLGKTIQTIALLAHLASHHEVWGPHLVIVPTSVMLNWEMEFKKWCPGFKILAYYGTQEERKRKRQGWNNDDIWNVCITSYQLVLQDQQVFKRRRWHFMILDEAHNIKNFKSQRWQTLLGFNTQARLLLTGTPLQNNLTELWSLLFFLMPSENGVGGFADLGEFQDWFHKPEVQILESGRETMDDEARAIIAKLHKVLRPYLLRRLKADVEKQMPAKYEHVEFCRMSKRQRELYDGFLARTDTRETLASGSYLSIINCLMQLRKVCNHPDLFVDRPIMTSFRMTKSVATDYEVTHQVVRNRLLATPLMSTVDVAFLNLVPTEHEFLSNSTTDRISQLSSHRALMDLRESQRARAQQASANLDPSSVKSNIVYLESAARWGRFEELQHCVYLNALRRQQRPIYGKRLVDFLTLGVADRPHKPRPKIPQKIMAWFEEDSTILRNMTPTLPERAASMQTTIQKFACVTPAVVTRDLDRFFLGSRGVEAFEELDLRLSEPIRWAPFMPKEAPLDPWHESRMKLSIQFPDKRLLQYDCGKLQALDKLLRKLQAGGHRALIFTQMTKVLDILEQFLNIHGHKYLRLDGATKVEQRQILTDRFNHDPRILCFILSTRSGGLGINLTGADTVIFYDQDWNPAMDKQCQDRCHRIGQTRDVHIYRLVSEHTIEANILRKASQKQMLDDVVIQEGEFTTDYFNKLSVRDVIGEDADLVNDGIAAADAAMDRVLGGADMADQRNVGRVLEQAEDKEDVAAAHIAEKEIQADDADFMEKPTFTGSGASSERQDTPRESAFPPGKSGLQLYSETIDAPSAQSEMELNAWGAPIQTIDDFMLKVMAAYLEGTPLDLPKDKKKSKKKGKDTRKR